MQGGDGSINWCLLVSMYWHQKNPLIQFRTRNECLCLKCQSRSNVPFTRSNSNSRGIGILDRIQFTWLIDRLEGNTKSETGDGNFEEWSHQTYAEIWACHSDCSAFRLGFILDWDDVISYGHFLPLGAWRIVQTLFLYVCRVTFSVWNYPTKCLYKRWPHCSWTKVWNSCNDQRTTILDSNELIPSIRLHERTSDMLLKFTPSRSSFTANVTAPGRSQDFYRGGRGRRPQKLIHEFHTERLLYTTSAHFLRITFN